MAIHTAIQRKLIPISAICASIHGMTIQQQLENLFCTAHNACIYKLNKLYARSLHQINNICHTAGVVSILPYIAWWFVYSSAWSILCGSESIESVRFLLLVAKDRILWIILFIAGLWQNKVWHSSASRCTSGTDPAAYIIRRDTCINSKSTTYICQDVCTKW